MYVVSRLAIFFVAHLHGQYYENDLYYKKYNTDATETA
jgi:hypothetical protein